MADAPAPQADPKAPAAPEPVSGAPAANSEAAPKSAEDWFEVLLDGQKEPVKIPVSKVPVEKLNPHLAKLRAEADRRMSEADKRSKELDAKAEKYGSIEALAAAVSKDPRKLADLGKSLGLTKTQILELSEAEIAEQIRDQLRDGDEAKNPELKARREEREELDRLRKEKAERADADAKAEVQAVRAQIERLMISALDKFKPELRLEAAREMVSVLQAAEEEKRELTPDALAAAARGALGWRANTYYSHDDGAEMDDSVLRRAEAILQKRAAEKPQHPAAKPNPGKNGEQPRGTDGKFAGTSSDVLLRLLRPAK